MGGYAFFAARRMRAKLIQPFSCFEVESCGKVAVFYIGFFVNKILVAF